MAELTGDRGAAPLARLLIVDDDVAILRTIKRYLGGYEVEVADSVEAALGQLRGRPFDLMLLDHRLPDGLGDQVIVDVRGRRSSLPIIVMSGDLDTKRFTAGAHGADDFIEKPFVREALLAKIERLLSAYQLRREAARQRAELDALHARHDREIEVACTIFDRMAARGEFEPGTVRQLVLPADRLAGDVVFGRTTATGSYRWMIGDVTGHTLSSALVTLTLAGVFYGPARAGDSLAELLATMERELTAMLPASMFCVAAMCELDRRAGTLQVWNGGSPSILILRASGELIECPSTDQPLAADRFAAPSHCVVSHRVEPGDRVLAFSDGLVELRDRHDQLIGFDRLRELAAAGPAADAFDRLLGCIASWTGDGGSYDDDISMIEVVV